MKLFNELNEETFMLYAIKNYYNPMCIDVEEFYEALKKVTSASIKLSGIYPGYFGNYAFVLNLND